MKPYTRANGRHPVDDLLYWLDADGPHQIVSFVPDVEGGLAGHRYEIGVSTLPATPNANLYFTANTPAPDAPFGTKLRKQHIIRARAVWADVDPPKDCSDLAAWKAQRLQELRADTLAQSAALIDSGGGFQLVWRIAGVSPQEAEHINQRLAHHYKADGGIWNIDRILRCPGTINHPDARKRARGRTPAPTSLVWLPADAARSALVAASFGHLPAAPVKDAADTDVRVSEALSILRASDWLEHDVLLPGVQNAAGALWEDGHPADPLDHSRNRIALARAMARAGYDIVDFASAVWRWPLSGIHDEKHETHGKRERQIARAWVQASTRVEQEAQRKEERSNPDRWFDPADAEDVAGGGPDTLFDAAPKPSATPRRIFASPVSPEMAATLPPPREWLYGKKILRRYTTVIGAPPGVGKTAYSTAIALSCASGVPLLGDAPHAPLRVWVLNLEDPRDEMMLRFQAAARYYGVEPDTWNRLFLDSGRDMPISLVRADRDGQLVVQNDLRELEMAIVENGIDIVFFDPWLRALSVPENDNDLIDKVVAKLNEVAERTRCAFVFVHHTKKGAEAGAAEGLRGASALIGGARIIMMMSQMTEEDAVKWGVPVEKRRLYVRVDDAKANLAPVLGAEWVHLENVHLDNGTEDYPMGENVQVATLWAPEDPSSAIDEGLRARLLDALQAGSPAGEAFTRHQNSRSGSENDRCVFRMMKDQFGFEKGPAQALLASFMRHGLVSEGDVKTKKGARKGLIVTYVSGGHGGVFD